MQRIRRTTVVAVFAVCALGLGAWSLGVATRPASGHVRSQAAPQGDGRHRDGGQAVGARVQALEVLRAARRDGHLQGEERGHARARLQDLHEPATSSAKNACVGKVTKMLKTRPVGHARPSCSRRRASTSSSAPFRATRPPG